ncbi:protein ecdysoneless homolog [Silene latifolia]|uniref:protein ecdysoneless homolog n=1 Tax=Silene latifolia TaxID=37657 RepID=UPI003D781924
MASAHDNDDPFSTTNHRTHPSPDTIFYTIHPDPPTTPSQLHTLNLQILTTLTPFTTAYTWHHTTFTLTPTATHLHGHLRYGDNLDDEWFVVFLLFHISRLFHNLSIRVWDSDGEFLLIEAAFHLPKWVNPETAGNRVFIRGGEVCIVPKKRVPGDMRLEDALRVLVEFPDECRANDDVQSVIKRRVDEFPEKAKRNVHRARVLVLVSVAKVLRQEPCMISLAVEGFYDRDIDNMKHAAKMEKFLPKGREEELVLVLAKMSRAMYAQLMQQKFQAPKCYPMPPVPPKTDQSTYLEAELGMKIACGFEMMYQQKKREEEEGKGSTWEVFRDSLEKSGYFQGLLPGSYEYKRLMENAKEYYKKSAVHHEASEMLSAPVKRIDEILALPLSMDDFKVQEVPSSDDNSWLYGGEEELNSVLTERQREMEQYEEKKKKKQKVKEKINESDSSIPNENDVDLGDIAKLMKAFMDKVSTYKGAEVPEDSDLEDVEFDMDRFMKELGAATMNPAQDVDSDDVEGGSSSDMDFDESEDDSDMEEEPEEHGDMKQKDFTHAYSDVLNDELKSTTLKKSFVRANDHSPYKNEALSGAGDEEMDDNFTPVDVDVNLVKSLLDSFSSQQGLPGPASNLLGLMGKQLPLDDVAKPKHNAKPKDT